MPSVAYAYGDGLYLNITNQCPIACVFCLRHTTHYQVAGADLRLKEEPGVDAVVSEAVALRRNSARAFQEIVFCGMGEPLMRPEVVVEVSERLRNWGVPIRVDTCGLGNLVHGRDLTPDLARVVDTVSISLNASNAEDYAKVCPSKYGVEAFPALLDFIRLSRERFARVALSVVHPDAYARAGVECPIDLDACRQLAESLELPLRIRGKRSA